MKKYNLYSICSVLLLVVLLKHPSKAQQPYVNNYQTNCNQGLNITNGFKCNGVETSCQSYLTFRSTFAYGSPLSIGQLLGVNISISTEIDTFKVSQIISTDTLTINPVNCSCLGKYYQHNSSYQVLPDDSFFTIANDTYQGLTTCQALMRENPQVPLTAGVNVSVPLRCACPTPNQTASGFKSLLTYIITWGDDISTIAGLFGADKQSILDANELSDDSIIFPLTPLLIPLKGKPPISIFKSVILDADNSENRWANKWIWLIVTIGGIIIASLCFLYHSKWKKQKAEGERKKKQKILVMELGGNAITCNVHDKVKKQSKDGQDGLQTFSFKSIYDATSNFSTENKLGEGGFGPVYKSQTQSDPQSDPNPTTQSDPRSPIHAGDIVRAKNADPFRRRSTQSQHHFDAVPPPAVTGESDPLNAVHHLADFSAVRPPHLTEAAKGNKPSSTFRAGSFALVVKEISAQFGVECHPSYVDNRMRTLRTMWSTIEKLRKKSGFGWDDNLKMITCDAKTYQEEVMAHRKHADFLNKKIEMYDELALVVGKDIATGGFSKSYIDYENEPDNGNSAEFVADNVEEDVLEKGKNVVKSSTTGSEIFKSRKRGRAPSTADDSVLTDLSDQLKDIATALKEINRGLVDYTSLYEVMAMMADGYSEEMLATVFDHLCENEKVARGFLAKNARLRKMWLDSFFFSQL
nr:protein lyk5 [Quercus suber]